MSGLSVRAERSQPVGSIETIRTRAAEEARRRLAVTRRRGLVGGRHGRLAFLGVHAGTVRKWVRKRRAGETDGPAGTPHPGCKPFLTPEQEEAEALG